MSAPNPITALRDQRTKSRRAPMFLNRTPRPIVIRELALPEGMLASDPIIAAIEERQRRIAKRARRVARLQRVPIRTGKQEAARRVRQGHPITAQHPSVIERFKNHPTRAQIEAVAAPKPRTKSRISEVIDKVVKPRKPRVPKAVEPAVVAEKPKAVRKPRAKKAVAA